MYFILLLGAGAGLGQSSQLINVTQGVADACQLQGWQYALRWDNESRPDQPLVKVELSPTLTSDQVTCVYQTLAQWKYQVSGELPVQVKPVSN
jgi:hypothetical protein